MKSYESDLLELVTRIYQDACARCTVNVSDLRDLLTIRSRVEREGLSFLTITLPSFAKEFEKTLAIGRISPTDFPGFRKTGSIPAFLQGMIGLVFDRETGRRIDEPESTYIDVAMVVDSVRQICRTFNKLQLDCTPKRVAEAIQGFVQIERDLATFSVPDPERSLFERVSDLLWAPSLSSIKLDSLWCAHGPGATSERVSGNQKYVWRYWFERLEPYFPFLENGYNISAFDSQEFEQVAFLPPDQELPVRVTPVPKTLKGPRIIAIEPCCMQYAQQAIRRELYRAIENSAEAGGHVNFTDQSVNQRMAMDASNDGSLATVDLSEASDRVPRSLALSMFNCNPDLRDAIDACRSTHAQLQDGTIIGPLYKFASMGSALCFPVEAMYFYTICVLALLEIRNLPVTYSSCMAVKEDVYIYGDDIIIPADETVAVLDYLSKYNCKVNVHKTFWHGFFRESCGVDAYKGVNVTPVYVRRTRPKNRRQASEIISWVKTANLFYKKGYWRTVQYLYESVERVIGPLPYVAEDSPALGRISFLGYRTVHRWNDTLHRFEVKAMVPEPVYRTDELEGYGALMKSLLTLQTSRPSRWDDPESSDPDSIHYTWLTEAEPRADEVKSQDKLHLERSALHGVAALKRRWAPIT